MKITELTKPLNKVMLRWNGQMKPAMVFSGSRPVRGALFLHSYFWKSRPRLCMQRRMTLGQCHLTLRYLP